MLSRHFFSLSLFCILIGAPAFADTLHLRDGRIIEADEVWEREGEIWYRQGQMISSVAKTAITQLKRQDEKTALAKNSIEATTTSLPPEANASVTAPRESQSRRIILKDGTMIDADALWEGEGSIRYRLGNMHAFIERSAVDRIISHATSEAKIQLPEARGLKFTTGHGGLDQLIMRNAKASGIDPLLIYLVMREESGFNHRAVSRAGARGLMQLMPATAVRFGVRNIHDPVENVGAGTRYLRLLIDRFKDVRLALAAYNAGEEAVARYGNRIPPYRETTNYVRRISAAYNRATKEE